jgi:hypothetical protein
MVSFDVFIGLNNRMRILEAHLQVMDEAIREGALCEVCPATSIGNGVTANNTVLCGLILKRSAHPRIKRHLVSQGNWE